MRGKVVLGHKKTGEYVKTTVEAGCYYSIKIIYSYEKDCI